MPDLCIVELHIAHSSMHGCLETGDGEVFDFCAGIEYDRHHKKQDYVEYVTDVECDGLGNEDQAELCDMLNNELLRHLDMEHT